MTEGERDVVIFLVDITGSTPLYESAGNAEAVRRVEACLSLVGDEISRAGGSLVQAKGDDVLAWFASPAPALDAASRIIARMPIGGLSVHAGLHCGNVVMMRGDLFGDAVNLTARLASLAVPGEVLVSRDLVERLPAGCPDILRPLDEMSLKGKAMPVEVFSLQESSPQLTEIGVVSGLGGPRQVRSGLSVTLTYEGREHVIGEGESLTMGRDPGNDVVLGMPWVSRRHASLEVRRGRVQLVDRSSYGSFVVDAHDHEVLVHRETMTLSGQGRISLGTSPTKSDAATVGYAITAD